MEERTLLLIKPDAVHNGNIGEIITIIERNYYHIIRLKMLKMDEQLAKEFYAVHKNKHFFNDLIKFMTSGNIVALELKRENAITHLRKLIGVTDSRKAEKGTIREKYGTDNRVNAVHASDSPQSAEQEIKTIFQENKITR